MRTNPLYDPAAGGVRAREALPKAGTPRVFSHGSVISGDYGFFADDAELPDGAVIVSTKRFLADRPSLLSRHAPLGVRLDTSQSPEILSADLAQLALIPPGDQLSVAGAVETDAQFGFGGRRLSSRVLHAPFPVKVEMLK